MDPLPDCLAGSHSDWGRLLPREVFQEIMLILRGALPPPVSDDPADEMRRDRAAMAGVASLQPVSAAEGRLAAQFVAADAWAMDCLRLAGERRLEFDVARKCRAQAMSLMRESKGALRALLRLQAVRRAIEGDEAAANRAAWAEHAALGMMAETLSPAPVASAPASAAPAARRQGGGEAWMSRPVSRHGIDVRKTPRETEAGFWPAPAGMAESPGVRRGEST